MKKITRKIIAFSMSLIMATSCATPTMAATVYKDSTGSVAEDISGSDIQGNDEVQKEKSAYSEYSDDESVSTDVFVTQKSTFTVIAPVVAVLNGKAGEVNSGDVTYKVYGNIASDETISVEPDTSFTLSQAGKDDITCTITSKDGNTAQTEFTYADGVRNDKDKALSQEYTITAENMTAGSWKGSYNTNIAINRADKWYDVTDQVEFASKDGHWDKYTYLVYEKNYQFSNIKVKPGETYRLTSTTYGHAAALVKKDLGVFDNSSLTPDDNAVIYDANVTNQEITIPDGYNYLCVTTSVFTKSKFKLEKLNSNTLKGFENEENISFDYDGNTYVTITIDDTNDNIDELAAVFKKHNAVCNWATQPSRLEGLTSTTKEYKKDVLLAEQERGSEILAHDYRYMTYAESEEQYYEYYQDVAPYQHVVSNQFAPDCSPNSKQNR